MNQLEDFIRATEAQIRVADHSLLAEVPPERYVSLLDQVDDFAGYRGVTPEIDATCNEILRRTGERGLEYYHKLILLRLIQEFDCRAVKCNYSDSVRELFYGQFQRIIATFPKEGTGVYLFKSDSFRKDLAICRQRLIPCGVQFLDSMSGIPRSWMLRGGVGRTLRMARTILKLGGFRPLYQLHTDHRQLHEFNPTGWLRCYGRTAALLRLNPKILGVFGSTWWYDPAIAEVSPRLRYLRDVPESAGAQFFYIDESEDNTANAVANSPERYRKHAQGAYRPKRYAMIWPRRCLMEKASVEGWDG